MNIWDITQIILNVLLVSAVLYLILRVKRDASAAHDVETQIEELKQLRDSLDQSVQEALRISNRIRQDIQNKQQTAAQITQVVEKEKKALLDLLEEMRSEGFLSNRINEKFQQPWLNDKYSKAIKLSSEGFSPQEIAKKIDLPLGEVELVLTLRK